MVYKYTVLLPIAPCQLEGEVSQQQSELIGGGDAGLCCCCVCCYVCCYVYVMLCFFVVAVFVVWGRCWSGLSDKVDLILSLLQI